MFLSLKTPEDIPKQDDRHEKESVSFFGSITILVHSSIKKCPISHSSTSKETLCPFPFPFLVLPQDGGFIFHVISLVYTLLLFRFMNFPFCNGLFFHSFVSFF